MRLIDADELIKNYLNHCRTEFEIENCCMASENVLSIIQNAPTVELDESVIQAVLNKRCMTAVANEYLIALHNKRPHGKWIKDDNGLIGCSHCHIVWLRGTTAFCPNCGACMIDDGRQTIKI